MRLSRIQKRSDWEYDINLDQIDEHWESDEELKELIEREINGEITTKDITKILVSKYTAKDDNS